VIQYPYGFYAALRDEAPVHRIADRTFVVSRWDDVDHVVHQPELFSNFIGPRNDQILGGPRVGGDGSCPWPLPFTDGAEHRRQRSFCAQSVVRSRLTWFEPRIERLVDEFTETSMPERSLATLYPPSRPATEGSNVEGAVKESVSVSVDETLCAASAMCKRIAPQVFHLPDAADTAVVLQSPVTDPELIKLAEEAEQGCPTMAILLERA
jgi:ferredoxin